jgi:hypothetical protein
MLLSRFKTGQAVQIKNPKVKRKTIMNEPNQAPEKLEYTAPKLEQQPQFISITGASFPFGTVSGKDGGGE